MVACMPAGSEMLPVRTSPSSLPVRPMKNPLQRRVSAWLPTSWLKQTAFFTPAALNRSPAPRPAAYSVCPTWARMPRSRKTSEPEFIDTTGIPAAIAFSIAGLSASAFGMDTTSPVGFLATAASIRADMPGMSLSAPGAL